MGFGVVDEGCEGMVGQLLLLLWCGDEFDDVVWGALEGFAECFYVPEIEGGDSA